MRVKTSIFVAMIALCVAGSAWATLIYPPATVFDLMGGLTEEEVAEGVVSKRWKANTDLELLYRDSRLDEGDPIGIVSDPGFVPGVSRSYDVSWDLAARELYAIVLKAGKLWDVYVVGDDAQLTQSGETYTLTTSSSSLVGISQVSLYGVGVNVADGGTTLVLLGTALCLGALVCKRMSR